MRHGPSAPTANSERMHTHIEVLLRGGVSTLDTSFQQWGRSLFPASPTTAER